MAMDRVTSSWRGAERRRREQFPQLPPAPADYPVFPDTSAWPVVFPELPPAPGGGPRRPPQHTSKAVPPAIPADQMPKHVAVVMDGNGRWATQRGLSRTEGHKMGEAVLIDITCGAIEIGIKHLTVYAFSTENWRRSADEVRFLMGFNREVVRRRRENLDIMGVQMRWVGSRARMWRSVIKEFDDRREHDGEQRRHHRQLLRQLRWARRNRRSRKADRARTRRPGASTPNGSTRRWSSSTCTGPDIPDVDLFIRTSGEQRSSNFMLWQAAYAEYVFQDKLWPDYDRRDLWAACEEYAERNRRFGRA